MIAVRRRRYIRSIKRRVGGADIRGLKPEAVEEGHIWPRPYPSGVLTMIGLRRLDNIQECVEAVIRDKVPGDLIEAGVWRGGAAIFMRALLLAYGVRDKQVVAADSFDGVPPPRADLYPLDEDFDLHLDRSLAVPAEDVRANFDRFGLLDDRGEVVEGLFRNSLPALRRRRWSGIP